jgi:formiminotetrahydrofolate cyclodeaminase
MSRGKKAYAKFDAELSEALAKLGALGEELKASIDSDAACYQAVVAAYRAQRNAPEGELQAASEAVAKALRGATAVPLHVAECAAQVWTLAEALRTKTNPKMESDLTVATALARAAVEGAVANVDINLDALEKDTEAVFIAETRAKVAELWNLGISAETNYNF